MKTIITCLVIHIFLHTTLLAQEIPQTAEQQLENLADAGAETEDDTYLQEMAWFLKHPLDLNKAEEDELKQLRVLNDLQVQSFLRYRHLFGPLLHMYELQAIPFWDISTIRRIMPYCLVSPVDRTSIKSTITGGEHSILLRLSQFLEKKSASVTGYNGSPQRIFFRHRYTYKNKLQYGLSADKDAGEQFFGGAQKKGFDFYSFHFFSRGNKLVKALALGDFTVNMGQGLIQWQSLAFKKNADAMAVKRQSATLRPYTSAGEFYFYRGAGITLQKGKINTTLFASHRRLNANIITNPLSGEEQVSSILTSGYNRTSGELADRNRLGQQTAGASLQYRQRKWHVGLNAVLHRFSLPIQKRDEPYNLFAFGGNSWYNYSADYSATFHSVHFFGEAAIDKKNGRAIISGLLVSPDPRLDISVLYRALGKNYQAVYGNAFTENTSPSNEKGLYLGATLRPFPGWRADVYYDIYRFPWLKYQVDAPSGGHDYLVQLTIAMGKKAEIYSRIRRERKDANSGVPLTTNAVNQLNTVSRTNWRTQVAAKIATALTLRSRVEIVWYQPGEGEKQTGFLGFFDVACKPPLASWALTGRIQYYNTTGYDSRVYAYENDVAYSYSIPAFYGEGYRFYLVFQKDAGKNLQFWVRWAGDFYQKRPGGGVLPGVLAGGGEIRLQARIIF